MPELALTYRTSSVGMKLNPGTRRSSLSKKRIQITLAIILIITQYIVLIASSPAAAASGNLVTTTLFGCVIATILGISIAGSVSRYPGVESGSYLITGFCISYGMLLIFFILARVEYSRILLTTSFVINIIFFIVLNSRLRRRMKLRIGVVPEGHYRSLLEIDNIEWHVLEQPDSNVEGLDSIAADLKSDVSDEWERRLARFALQSLPVFHTKHLRESLTGKVELEHISENSFGTLSPMAAYFTAKHLLDVIAAVVGIIILSPLLLIIALIIRLDSPGPILFRQVRIGYQGKPFRVFKFRTMTIATDLTNDALEAAKTQDRDERVTRPGGFLRKSRLDELPQLLNVIKGEMSWIGPRPEAEVLSRWYETEIPFYQYRHIVRPGITGWAQVNQGHVAEVKDVRDKLYFDFYYIKQFSPWIDLLIVVRTIRTMVTGFGSR